MNKDYLKKAAELVSQHTVHDGEAVHILQCTLAMLDDDGSPTISPITASQAEDIKTIYFCTGLTSNKVKRLSNSNKVSVCFHTEQYKITLIGTLEVLTDTATKEKMWYPPLAHHFSGPMDANYCVLKFMTNRYDLLIDWQEIQGTLHN